MKWFQIITMLCLLAMPTSQITAAFAQSNAVASPEQESPLSRLNPQASAQDLKALLGTMTDDQVRRVFAEELDRRVAQEAEKKRQNVRKSNTIASFIDQSRKAGDFVRKRFMYLFSGAGTAPRAMPEAFQRAFGVDKRISPTAAAVGVLLLTVLYALAEWFVRRKTRVMRERISATPEAATWLSRIGRLFLRAILDIMSLTLVAALVFIVYLLLVGNHPAAKPVVVTWMAAMLLWGVVRIIARFTLAPKAPALRFLPIPDTAASYLYRWTDRFGLLMALSFLFTGLLRLENDSEALHLLVLSGVGLVLTILPCILIVSHRREVSEFMVRNAEPASLRMQFSGVWHYAAVIYLLVFWVVWVCGLILFGAEDAWNGLAALLCIPVFLLLNWLAQRLVHHTTLQASRHDNPKRVARVKGILSNGFRMAIGAGLFLWLLSLYDVHIPLGAATVRAVLNVLVTLVLAYLFWLYVSSAIEERIGPDDDEEDEEAEGGHGGDRLTTLLQLLRKFIFVALLVLVVLICLSSMGVNIGPLLAGASIFGIAIGFGSQTLVKDIVSGIFFLLDDAIRVGDYIEVGNAKGTVERISIRSMQLRHHLGMVYTIPFGHISQVKNMTRDYSIMKLAYHVPFDTDVNRIKQIVKRIDKELRAVPEFDSVLLSKIKSQGVKTVDEVGILMRIKFTTKPGGQFSVRKAVLTKLKTYFEEAGIEFAHRKVTVHVAADEGTSRDDMARAGAAAQIAADDAESHSGNDPAEER